MSTGMALAIAAANIDVQRFEGYVSDRFRDLELPRRRKARRSRESEWRRAMRQLERVRERLARLQADAS